MRSFLTVCAGVAAAACLATSAHAADSVWWTNNAAPRGISFAAIDGSTSGNVPSPGAAINSAQGLAFDLAAGRAYFVDATTKQLRFVKLDGSGSGVVPAPGVTLNNPVAVAIDPVAGRAYIANKAANNVVFVKLDGSGGGVLNTTGASTTAVNAITVDPAGGRVYFAATTKISFANIDNTGGQDLNTTGASPVNVTTGIAVDPTAARVYWANDTANKISFANVNGGGATDLNTAGATITTPRGLAIDAAGGRIYWGEAATVPGKIAFARLDNTGATFLTTGTATLKLPSGVAVIKAPVNTAPPAITGTATTGQTLTCSDGTWAADVLPSFLYQSAQGPFTYAWAKDNQPVTGQTAKTLVASQAGSYTCTVTATNSAGSANQTSATVAVTGGATPPPPPTPPAATVTIGQVKSGAVSVNASAAGQLTVTGGIKKISRSVQAGPTKLKFTLSTAAKRRLARKGRVSVTLTAKLTPTGGTAVSASKTITIKR